jgi:hypothetical protein
MYKMFAIIGVAGLWLSCSPVPAENQKESEKPPTASPASTSPAALVAPAKPTPNKSQIRSAVIANAKEAYVAKNYDGALTILDRVTWLQDDPEVKKLHSKIAREAERTRSVREAQARKEKLASGIATRKAYAATLREKFLDDGLDIKVAVKGKNAEVLYLTYPLFNDVWTHKFSKGSLIDEIQGLGFTRVDFDDNYEFHKYFKL